MASIPEPSEFWGWGENWYELTDQDFDDLSDALIELGDWGIELLKDFSYVKNGVHYGRCSRIDEMELAWLEDNGFIFDWVPFVKSQYPVQQGYPVPQG